MIHPSFRILSYTIHHCQAMVKSFPHYHLTIVIITQSERTAQGSKIYETTFNDGITDSPFDDSVSWIHLALHEAK